MSKHSAGSIIFVVIGIAVLVGLYAMKGVESHNKKVQRSIQQMQYHQNQQQMKKAQNEDRNNNMHMHEGHEWVDLGLSVRWATCNVGATSPEDFGDYFAWGETSTKSEYTWSTLRYCSDEMGSQFTKYVPSDESDYWSGSGSPDNKTRLVPGDDVAQAKWGGTWHMPTRKDWEELLDEDNCSWTWTQLNGVNGMRVKSRSNGNSIFLPAAGYRYAYFLRVIGQGGCYWSSSLYTPLPDNAWYISISEDDYYVGMEGRCFGQSVRPVAE